MAQTSYSFTGNGSFLSNHYVIYKPGALGPDAQQSNLYGTKQGKTYLARMFTDPSNRPNSSYTLFCNFIKKIALAQRQQEKSYLKTKLKQLENGELSIGKQKNTERIKQIISRVIDNDPFTAPGGYTTAFTALLRYEKNLQQVSKELAKGSSITKLNSLFRNRFEESMAKELGSFLIASWDDELKQGGVKLSDDFDIDSFIDRYLQKVAGKKISQVANQSLDGWRKNIKSSLLTRFYKFGIEIPPDLQSLIEDKENITLKSTDWFLKGKKKKKVRVQNTLGRLVINSVARGAGEEFKNIKIAGSLGGVGVNSGNVLGENGKNMTTDNIILDSGTVTIDMSKIADEVLIRDFNGIFPKTEQELTNFINKIEEQARLAGAEELFELHISAKEYVSDYDLKILEPDSFENTLKRLEQMSNKLPNSALSAVAIDGNYFDKLIFALLNTAEGAIAEKNIEQIKLNISSIFATWVWSDYREVMSKNIKPNLKVNRIHLFDQGGAYYTASEMVALVYNQLIEAKELSNTSSFVNVSLTPPKKFDSNIYSSWYNAQPEDPEWEYSVGSAPKDEEGKPDYQSVQNILQKRWDEVRNSAMQTGKLGISFRQKELEKLTSQLSELLGIR